MPAALRYFAFTLYLILSSSSAEYIQFAFSTNPVYSGNSITLTCSYYAPRYYLSQVEIEAFNGTLTTGYMTFHVESVNLEARGVFSGASFDGYPNIPTEVRSVGLTLIANPSFELDYICTLHLNSDYFLLTRFIDDYYYDSKVLTSTNITLHVRVVPLPPVFTQNPLIFTDNDDASIECSSPFGRPVATIAISVTSTSGKLASATGSESASLTLPRPVADWHEATALCTVTNHNLPNMTVSSTISINRSESVLLILPVPLTNWHTATANCTVRNPNLTNGIASSGVFINHIKSIGVPDPVNTTESDAMLDCSVYIRSFPDVIYQWSVPPETYVSNLSLLTGSHFSALRGQTGLFNCTAKNVVTMQTSSVIYNLTSLRLLSADALKRDKPTREQYWITVPVACRIVIFVIVFSILFHRVCSMKRNSSQLTRVSGESGTSSNKRSGVTNEYLECVDQQYESLSFQLNSEPTYAQLVNAKPLYDVIEYANIGYLH